MVGWLSLDEVAVAATNMKLTVDLTTDWVDFISSPTQSARILLHEGHYYLRLPGNILFDPAGPTHLVQALANCRDLKYNSVAYQTLKSSLCGQFCLFAARLFSTRSMDASEFFEHLSSVLPNPYINEFLITWFTFAKEIGEEFYDRRYARIINRFRSLL